MNLPNHLIVDNPNIPVIKHRKPEMIEYGKFTETHVENFGSAGNTSVIKLKDMYLPNFSLRVIEAQFSEDAAFYNEHGHGNELLGSCVFFKARIRTILPGERHGMDLYHRTHNFKYDPNNEFLHLTPANSPLSFVHFSYTSDYLNQILPQNEAWAERLKESIVKRERIIGKEALPITLAQDHALHNIFNCPLSGKLGEMMIETSIVQLILIQLNGLFGQNSSLAKSNDKQENLIAHELKDYLTQSYLQDHSIEQLARQYGVNSNKLMALFKSAFGKSIFEYLGELRMEHAMHLLTENNHRVIDIARTLGYKNPNHFTTAFKKRYGVTPTELR
ncbi:MAG: helix-turn-helix transcriptional regulator [Cyclobacteriaceae bacterium]|nr:helix-turn-helix transcriptional regulator [Cyclobacteriaceae bacterium]